MKIAFISYEFPPDTAFGGIATYVQQAAHMMHSRGHHVEVFAGSSTRATSGQENGILVHRFITSKPPDFAQSVAEGFMQRHTSIHFDVIEGPEYLADARVIVQYVPDIPLVVVLHTSSYQSDQAGDALPTVGTRLRIMAGAIRRMRKPFHYVSWFDKIYQIERNHARQADEIIAPSLAIGKKTGRQWHLDPKLIFHIPYPYSPSAALLSIPPETNTNTVTFLGQLARRKGVYSLAQSIPIILKEYPEVRFRFVGRPAFPELLSDLTAIVLPVKDSVEFVGPVALNSVPDILAQTDICVFPSHWENHPLVCLESLAAARGVVGSKAGGMAEILDAGRVGKLIPPRSPQHIAKAVIELLANPKLRIELGIAGRKRVLDYYNNDRIGELKEASYLRAIKHRKQLGPRDRQVE